MRWGISADWHLACHRILGGPVAAGVNLRCRLIGEAGARVIAKAAEVGCERFAILGDLFDRGKPSPEEIGVAAKVFAESPIPVYVIPGNHDRSSDEPGNNALAALVGTKNCIVVDEPAYLEDGVILAPFSPRPPFDYFADVLKQATTGPKFLLGHVGIIGDAIAHFLLESRNAITISQISDLADLAERDKGVVLRAFASGDWHLHAVHNALHEIDIVQVGALCQANFGDPLEVGKLCVLDTEKSGIKEIYNVPGPRFITEDFAELKRAEYGGETGFTYLNTREELDACDLFFSVRCKSEAEQREVEAIIKEWEGVAGWKTELVSTAKQQTEVVEAVQGAVQVEDALQEWAAAQPGVSQAVKDRAVQIALECLR